MNRNEFIKLVDALRIQLRDDGEISPEEFSRQLEKANALIDEIAAAERHVVEMQRTLPTLKQTVKTYYTVLYHRSLVMQFALHDLETLERTFVEDTD